MSDSIKQLLHSSWLRRLFTAIGGLTIFGVLVVVGCNVVVRRDGRYILPAGSTVRAHIGIVLGAGITPEGKPYKELQARLDVAAAGVMSGQVDGLILSGDNSHLNYDEPKAMMHYLVTVKHVPASRLQVDDAGLDTYASCKRAATIFHIVRAIIYSAPSHLPRAIFLCRHVGIEAYGVSSGVDGSNASRREALAAVKAVLNVTVAPEDYIGGPPIDFHPASI